MGKVYAFVANGSEEVELLAVVDVLLRGGQDVKLVSVTGSRDVVSAHQIKIQADLEFSEADFSDADVLFLPGGMPGTRNLAAHRGLCDESAPVQVFSGDWESWKGERPRVIRALKGN